MKLTYGSPVGASVDYNEISSTGKDAILLHRKVYEDATERTHTGDTAYSDTADTFSLACGSNALIVGISVEAQLKNSDASKFTAMALKLTGANTGTEYFRAVQFIDGGVGGTDYYGVTLNPTQSYVFQTNGNTYKSFKVSNEVSLEVKDEALVCTIQIKTTDSTTTAYMQEVKVEVVYAKNYVED